jgi:CheY-like chemotaxis protein
VKEPLRVLVVDDNRDAADSLAILLKLWGHNAHIAYDGRTALDAALTFKPRVILLDYSMPLMHGGEVARQLRELPEFRQALIVATTANSASDPRLDGWRHHFNLFLTKPYNLATLEELLASHAASPT